MAEIGGLRSLSSSSDSRHDSRRGSLLSCCLSSRVATEPMVEGQSPPDFESDDVTICTAANTKWHIRAFPPAGALLAFYHPKFGPVGFTPQETRLPRSSAS